MVDMDGSAAGFTSVNANAAPPATVTAAPDPAPEPWAGAKRKRESKGAPKFYAVRVGKVPGIYHTWADCLDQVRGYPKAMFKSFPVLSDAENYLAGDDKAESGPGKSTGKWYGVQSGRVPGVYTTWGEVLEQITGWKGPKHRGFKTRIEAELFVKEGQMQQQQEQQNGLDSNGYSAESPLESIEATDGTPASKKPKLHGKSVKKTGPGYIKDENGSPHMANGDGGEYEPGEAPMPPDTEDGFDPSITLDPTTGNLRYKTGSELTKTKYQASRPAPDAPVRIYTDGSSLANGQAGAVGGVGVYFGPGDRRNISEHLAGSKQTNQRAELTAILRALEVAPKDRKIVILSDSNYAIKCSNEWFIKWRANNWLNAARKPVENKDLIQKIIENLEERQRINAHREQDVDNDDYGAEYDGALPGPWSKGPAGVRFKWVKGHDKDEGNNAADCLATAGAREARELMMAGDGDGDEFS
jgi:ribonuclease HI